MEGEEERGPRLSKRFEDKKGSSGGEVDYKTKAGTAWSHSYLNQKPWHPLSYPNQRRKWIAEQTHAQRQRRAEEVSREYAQEQEFFRQTALISKKEKEKMETMKAVSFMYVRPPGYNAESAKAAEINDEAKNQEPGTSSTTTTTQQQHSQAEEQKKPRPKDAFGRALPTEQEFQVLANAPRLDTGVAARAKPFGIEVRNVKCLRCGNYGHQSGDRECPLKDAIMPNEENRLKRDDPLTAIMAQTDPTEPLKWELKQKPGMSPPRGGFNPDDPNQQIVAEDIFDEYGGFLSGGNIPDLLTSFSPAKPKKKSKKSKRNRESSPTGGHGVTEEHRSSSPSGSKERRLKKKEDNAKKKKEKKRNHSDSSSSDDMEFDRHSRKSRRKRSYSSEDLDSDSYHRSTRRGKKHSYSSDDSGSDGDRYHKSSRSRGKHSYPSEDLDSDRNRSSRRSRQMCYSPQEPESGWQKRSKDCKKMDPYSHEDSDSNRYDRSKRRKDKHYSDEETDYDKHNRSKDRLRKHSHPSNCSPSDDRYRNEKRRHQRSVRHSLDSSDTESHQRNGRRNEKRRHRRSVRHSSDSSDPESHHRNGRNRRRWSSRHSLDTSDTDSR